MVTKKDVERAGDPTRLGARIFDWLDNIVYRAEIWWQVRDLEHQIDQTLLNGDHIVYYYGKLSLNHESAKALFSKYKDFAFEVDTDYDTGRDYLFIKQK